MILSAQAIDRRRSRRLLAAIGVVVSTLFVMQGVVPTPAMGATGCLVKDLRAGKTYSRLQAAVDAAKPGSHLLVKGTCRGTTIVHKDLVIRGKPSSRGTPTLDGQDRKRVMKVKSGVKLTMQRLTIEDGRSRSGSGGSIVNRGKLMLYAVTVRRSRARKNGGAIYNLGNLQVNSTSQVRGSEADLGGGIHNEGVVRLKGTSKIRGNVAKAGGGVHNLGTMRLQELSRIKNNRALPSGSGGGVHNEGTLSMKGSSSIRGNSADLGGGVVNDAASLSLADSSSISGNSAQLAGGVVNDAGSVLTMSGSSAITANYASDTGGLGNAGTLVGVKCAPGSGANVFGNTPDDCQLDWATGALLARP